MLLKAQKLPSIGERLRRRALKAWTTNVGKLVPKVEEKNFLNSAAWIIHGDIMTRVVFYNYFWRNYYQEALNLDLQLIDQEGIERWRDTRVLRQDETLVVDSAEISRAIGQESFEGYLVFTVLLKAKANPGANLIRFNVDYYSIANTISTVHDQAVFTFATPGHPWMLGKMEVIENDEVGTALIFVNSQSYEGMPVAVTIDVRSQDGELIHVAEYKIPPRGFRRIELGQEQPKLKEFLQGQSGQLIVQTDFGIARAAILHYSKKQRSSWYSVNHSEEYKGGLHWDQPKLRATTAMPVTSQGSGPMAPMPFFHNVHGLNTDLVFFHDVLAAGEHQVYGLSLYDNEGNLVFRKDECVTVQLHGIKRISLKDYLPMDAKIYGLAQIYLAPSSHNQFWQCNYPVDAHYILNDGEWDAMYSQGSTSRINAGEGTRTRTFGRVYCDENLQTDLVMIYPSTATGEDIRSIPNSVTQITLCDPTGKTSITRELKFKPQSTHILKLQEVFPEINSFNLKPGQACGVYVRDVTAKIITAHMTRNQQGTSLAVDHFAGG